MHRLVKKLVNVRVARGRGAAVVAVVALAAASVPVGQTLIARPAAASSGSTPSWMGVYPGNSGPVGVSSYESFVGGPAHYVTLFVNTGDWKYVDSLAGSGIGDFAGQGYRVVLSVPMIPTDSGNTLEQGAAGDLNSNFEDLAQQLVSMGMGNTIIRLGWELSGNWFAWSAQSDPAAYAEYWRQVVDTMRSVPGADFQFDWNGGAAGQTGWDPTAAYPGDAYVDYISADVYDWAPGYYSNNTSSPATTEAWWNAVVLNGTDGLNWTASFAAEHDKPMALPEWGLMNRPDGQGGGDDPTFVQDIYDFVTTHNVAYADYFDYDMGSGVDGNLQDGDFPTAAALYQRLFGPNSPSLAVASTSTSASTSTVPVTTSTSSSTTVASTVPVTTSTSSSTTVASTASSSTTVASTASSQASATVASSAVYDSLSAQSNLGEESRWPGYEGSAYRDGWASNGDYITFTVNASSAGSYVAALRYSAGSGAAMGQLSVDGKVIGNQSFPGTANWSTWASQAMPVTLNAGSNTITLTFDSATGSTGILNINNLTVSPSASSATVASSAVYDSLSAQSNLGEESRWPGYEGSAYRDGWASNGDYITFTVNASSAGSYVAALRYSAGSGAAMGQLSVDGKVIGNQSFPGTANWSTWASQAMPVTLNAGSNTITLTFDSATGSTGILNINNLTVSPSASSATVASSAVYDSLSAQSNLGEESRWPGYEGSAYRDGWASNGDYITFTVNASSAGSYVAALRYSAGSGAAMGQLSVDGKVIGNQSFPGTANWSTWASQAMPVTLNAGSNTITLTFDSATGSTGILNINNLTVSQ